MGTGEAHGEVRARLPAIPTPDAGRRRWRAACLAACTLLLAQLAAARLVFDPADAAFAGSSLVPLDTTSGFVNGQRTHKVVVAGTTLDFASLGASPLYVTSGIEGESFVTFSPAGVEVRFGPAVAAVGLRFGVGECGGVVTFEGSAGTETHRFGFGQRQLFVGAANIGDIRRLVLNDACFAASWHDLRFVPGAGSPPTGNADLGARKTSTDGLYDDTHASVHFDITVANNSATPSRDVQVVDFLPAISRRPPLLSSTPAATLASADSVSVQSLGTIAGGGSATAQLEIALDARAFNCGVSDLNVALATSSGTDPVSGNNIAWRGLAFDDRSRSGRPEICGNNIDDNCNGLADCAERGDPCNCFAPPAAPLEPPGTGCTFVVTAGAVQLVCPGREDDASPEPGHRTHCEASFSDGSTSTVPMFCCEPPPPDPMETVRRAACATASASYHPVDPNFKESIPAVNVNGHGYTYAGFLQRYFVTYENVGRADAHDVQVLDVLDEDLDASTLVVDNAGVFDAAQRTIVWRDAVLPPGVARTVGFSVRVRSDAPVDTIVSNKAVVIFPDALPPSRVDTNTTRHLVIDPANPPRPGFQVLSCSNEGGDRWRLRLGNTGHGYAYNVRASILAVPMVVTNVLPGSAGFVHPDDPPGDALAPHAFVPLRWTDSANTLAFHAAGIAADPCLTFDWRIEWQDRAGRVQATTLAGAPDPDGDAVASRLDNCPAVFNPNQLDTNGDGQGDACTAAPAQVTGVRARAKANKVNVVFRAASGALEHVVERAMDGGPYGTVANALGGTTFVDANLPLGHAWCYRVSARNAAGVVGMASVPACTRTLANPR